MDPRIELSISNLGSAQVIVVLKQDVARRSGKKVPSEVAQNLSDSLPKAFSAKSSLAKNVPPLHYFPLLGVCIGYTDRKGAEALETSKAVESVLNAEQLSLIRPIKVAAAKIKGKLTWGLSMLGVEKLWEQGIKGKGVRVGHLDTGVDAKHKTLKGQVKGFMEFDYAGNRVPNSKPHDSDSEGHGTHTAGTICGKSVKGLNIGVAPAAKLYSGLVIEGGEVLVRVLNGMEWCLEEKIKVLSMSLGFRGYTPFFLDLTKRLRSNGVLPVFAIGNEGPGTSRSPGNYAEALSVGAIDSEKQVAYFSSSITFNRPVEPQQPNVVAPGVDVISAKPGGGVQSMDGTSMATPHVAGVAALLFQAKPDASIEQVEEAIQTTCEPLTGIPQERYGFGLANPQKALDKLIGSR
ncbi:MAG: S8 family serine peptidase [archaeon]|nr:S8 family serine peptidase [archaeon]